MKKPNRPTYAQLHQFLLQMGFTRETAAGQLRVYRHADSDTLIAFSAHSSDTPARDADLISLRKHLVETGLIDDRTLARRLKSIATSAQ